MRKCSVTGKVKHLSRRAAQKAMYEKVGKNGIVGTTYLCPECKHWHTTRRT